MVRDQAPAAKAVAEVAGGVISRCRVAWSARLDKSSNPTIVPRQSLSGPRIACFSHPFSGALSKGNPAWLASGGVFHCPNFKSRVSELGQHRKLGTGPFPLPIITNGPFLFLEWFLLVLVTYACFLWRNTH